MSYSHLMIKVNSDELNSEEVRVSIENIVWKE